MSRRGAPSSSTVLRHERDAWTALVNGNHVALIRHGSAPPGYGDPPGFKIDNCATQRNMDERGRAQARALGEAFRQHGVPVQKIISSPWCRCLETARLMALVGRGLIGAESGASCRAEGDGGRLARTGHACGGDARVHRPRARWDHAGANRDRGGQAQAAVNGRRGHDLYAQVTCAGEHSLSLYGTRSLLTPTEDLSTTAFRRGPRQIALTPSVAAPQVGPTIEDEGLRPQKKRPSRCAIWQPTWLTLTACPRRKPTKCSPG
jgi:hypothetical protein